MGIVVVTLLMGCRPSPPPTRLEGAKEPTTPSTITVAAAADLKFALEDVMKEFRRLHAEIEVQPTYGSSGSLFAQISNGAPIDLFLSADIEFPRKLIEQQQAIAELEFAYAIGHLVVWVRQESTLPVESVGIQVLKDEGVRKIAIANPKTAPYGRAAETAILHFGLEDAVRDKLVLGENIAQAAQFVESGAADVGIIALSSALAPAMKGEGRYWSVPSEAHPQLLQGGVILSKTKDRSACEQFRSFMLSPPGREILRRYGFELPGE